MHKIAASGTHIVRVTTSCLTGLKVTQQEGNHVWSWNPNRLPGASEVMDLIKTYYFHFARPVFNSLLRHKSHSYTSQISVIVTPFQVSIFLQQIETVTECRDQQTDHGDSSPNGYIYSTLSLSVAQEIVLKEMLSSN